MSNIFRLNKKFLIDKEIKNEELLKLMINIFVRGINRDNTSFISESDINKLNIILVKLNSRINKIISINKLSNETMTFSDFFKL